MAFVEQLQAVAWDQATACVAGAYLLGCFSTGYYLVRARTGRDIRDVDSGATGARNVSRVLGATGFLLTLLGDFCKGALAVWAAGRFTGSEFLGAVAMIMVVVGHIWPAQLRCRGGKGVATSLGALLFLDWRVAIAYAAIFALGFLLTRKTILPGLFAYVCLPFASHGFDPDPAKTTAVAVLAMLVLVAHRNNFVEEIPALAARCGVNPNPEQPKL